MQNAAWVAILRHIPAEQHNRYMLVTASGTEISIQGLLRIEQEFVAIKGRLAGSQDAGRVFFIPYDHIDYFGTLHPIKDSDFSETFDSLVMPGPTCPVVPEPMVAAMPSRVEPPARPLIRSEVLERYRSRPSSSSSLPRPNES